MLLTSFLVKVMNDWLSVKTGIGAKSCLKSFPSLINQIPSADAIDPATNLASIEERITRLCFFEAQETGAPLNVKTQPVVDLRSFTSPAKSASVNPARLCV